MHIHRMTNQIMNLNMPMLKMMVKLILMIELSSWKWMLNSIALNSLNGRPKILVSKSKTHNGKKKKIKSLNVQIKISKIKISKKIVYRNISPTKCGKKLKQTCLHKYNLYMKSYQNMRPKKVKVNSLKKSI